LIVLKKKQIFFEQKKEEELSDRTAILDLMKECEPVKARPVAFLGIDERTIQRWKLSKLREDCRKGPLSQPASSFFQEELQAILKVVTSFRILRQEPPTDSSGAC